MIKWIFVFFYEPKKSFNYQEEKEIKQHCKWKKSTDLIAWCEQFSVRACESWAGERKTEKIMKNECDLVEAVARGRLPYVFRCCLLISVQRSMCERELK